jgi:hypothetical protein
MGLRSQFNGRTCCLRKWVPNYDGAPLRADAVALLEREMAGDKTKIAGAIAQVKEARRQRRDGISAGDVYYIYTVAGHEATGTFRSLKALVPALLGM